VFLIGTFILISARREEESIEPEKSFRRKDKLYL